PRLARVDPLLPDRLRARSRRRDPADLSRRRVRLAAQRTSGLGPAPDERVEGGRERHRGLPRPPGARSVRRREAAPTARRGVPGARDGARGPVVPHVDRRTGAARADRRLDDERRRFRARRAIRSPAAGRAALSLETRAGRGYLLPVPRYSIPLTACALVL